MFSEPQTSVVTSIRKKSIYCVDLRILPVILSRYFTYNRFSHLAKSPFANVVSKFPFFLYPKSELIRFELSCPVLILHLFRKVAHRGKQDSTGGCIFLLHSKPKYPCFSFFLNFFLATYYSLGIFPQQS